MEEQATILMYDSGLIKEETAFLNLQNSERVAFVYNAVLKTDKFKDITSVPKVMKSNGTSTQYRMLGNDLFVRRKRFSEALEMYNKSIAHAENDSSFLALAYGNRSAVLFERKYYKECVEDIERALSNNYPVNLKEKLVVRKTKAEQLKHQQKQVNYYIPLPEITNKNPRIAAASSAVKIQSNRKYGRLVIAKKRIKVGDIISLENSYTHMIHPESKFLHCHECLELCYNLIPCRNCTVALYCSETCLKRSFNSYHKYECDFVPVMRSPQTLFIRIALKGLEDNQNKKDDVAEEVYLSDRFKEINNLTTNEDKRCFKSLCIPTIMASLAYHCLKNNAEFTSKYASEIDSLLQTFLYRACMIDVFNSFNIKKIKHTCIDVTQKRVGTAIYAFTSLYNHSCVPNCEFFHHGTMLATRAIANIKKGEQCTLCYGMSYSNVPASQRKLALKKNYLFDCDCKACQENWPLFEFLPLGKQLPLSFEEKTMLNTYDESDDNKKLLDELLTEAIRLFDTLEKYEPCRNLLRVQNLITEIYTYPGSKDLDF